jgi:hypothetical protein
MNYICRNLAAIPAEIRDLLKLIFEILSCVEDDGPKGYVNEFLDKISSCNSLKFWR